MTDLLKILKQIKECYEGVQVSGNGRDWHPVKVPEELLSNLLPEIISTLEKTNGDYVSRLEAAYIELKYNSLPSCPDYCKPARMDEAKRSLERIKAGDQE